MTTPPPPPTDGSQPTDNPDDPAPPITTQPQNRSSVEPRRRGWWSRNWAWALPLATLSPILCCGGVIVAIVATVSGIVRYPDVYKDAAAHAMASPQIIEVIGEPIEVGLWTEGNLSVLNGKGVAKLTIPLTGPNGAGNLIVDATSEDDGPWTYHEIKFTTDAGQTIDINTDTGRIPSVAERLVESPQ